ncbi:hypothetical protein ABLG96_07880 [Nakamurella sp. A5-74]|uniref:Uncharacterized protein n=1 Tax=Nakamurella sp. A5-74 TaxID=3158264 RepID=A0AAU8DSS2_9ACTN
MTSQHDLQLAVREAYDHSPIPESLTAAARALLNSDGTSTQTSAAEPKPIVVRAPTLRASRKRAVLAASLIAAAVAAVAILTTNVTGSRSDRDAAPTGVTQPPATSAPPTSTRTSNPSAGDTQPANTLASDMDLLRAIATGVIVQPDAGPPTDSSTVVGALNWSYTRSRSVPAPITDVIAWYQTNVPTASAPQPLTLIDSTLYPAGTTPELAAARDTFVQPQVAIRFSEVNIDTTRVDVIATGYHRDVHPKEAFIPAAQITRTELNWKPNDPREAKTRTIDKAAADELIDYLNRAPLKPALTYSGTTGGATFNITFTATDGHTYTAHWDSDFGGAGVALDLGAAGSQLVDPDKGFYDLLRELSRG